MKQNVGLHNDLKKCEVRCRHHKEGCKWTGYKEDSVEHEQMECYFVPNPKPTEERASVIPVKCTLQKFSDMIEDYHRLEPFYTHDGAYKI